ncbi:MAG: alpha/beta fold hydrolase [Blastocatellia bacterium]|nr:alpha/beta fold hydrolase [Blastocatellia bacterium]
MLVRLRTTVYAVLLALAFSAATFAQTPAPAPKQVTIYGQKISYLEAGSSGPQVILLHGLGGDGTNWSLTIPALAAKYHVYVPDQIGFGKSDKPIMSYRVATLVEFLDQFYRQLGIQKATLVGNSLGGWTAVAFAIAHPQKVDKLVLVSAAGYTPKRYGGEELPKEIYSVLNPSTTADLKRLFTAIFYDKKYTSDAFIAQAFTNKLMRGDGYTINSFIDSIMRGDDVIDDKVKTIRAPTLVVWGREDKLTSPAMADAFAQDISGAQKIIFEQCGHMAQIEKAQEFNSALLKFLAGDSVVGSR